jgi:hypothetical protein
MHHSKIYAVLVMYGLLEETLDWDKRFVAMAITDSEH